MPIENQRDPSAGAGAHGTAQTSPAFWDAQWDDRSKRSWSQQILHGSDFGRRGSFLRILNRYVGLDNLRGAKVIEFGGAASHYLVDLGLFLGADVTAVDYSQIGIDSTRAMFSHFGIRGTAIYGDMFALDIPESSYDVTTHWGLLEHFEDPKPVLAVCSRATKKDGLLIFTMPNMGAVGAKLWQRLAPENYSKHVYHSDDAIASACDETGFRLEKIFYSGPPLLRMAPAENSGLTARLIDFAHVAVCAANTVAPGIYTRGSARISNARGFVARRLK